MIKKELDELLYIITKFLRTGQFPGSSFETLSKEDRESPTFSISIKQLGKKETKLVPHPKFAFDEDTGLVKVEFKVPTGKDDYSYMEIPLCEVQYVNVKYVLNTKSRARAYKSEYVQTYKPDSEPEEDTIEPILEEETGDLDYTALDCDEGDGLGDLYDLEELADTLPTNTEETCAQIVQEFSEQKAKEVISAQHLPEEDELALLTRTIEYVLQKHKGQLDKAGKDYYLHPLTVAFHPTLTTVAEKVGGMLHDVKEDTDTSEEELYRLFPSYIIDAVLLLTHAKDVPYLAYIKSLVNAENLIALKVKRADLSHNMLISRIPTPTEKDYSRIEKYKIAYDIIDAKIREIEINTKHRTIQGSTNGLLEE